MKLFDAIFENGSSLGYSCHVLQSSLLTETQWIYRNFIGRETKPGHISTSLVCRAWISPINSSCLMQSFLTSSSIKTLKIPHSCTQVSYIVPRTDLQYEEACCFIITVTQHDDILYDGKGIN